MIMIFESHLGKVFQFGSVFLHMLRTSISEELSGEGGLSELSQTCQGLHVLVNRICLVREGSSQGALLHLLEAEGQNTLGLTPGNQLFGKMEGSGSCGAVIVDIVNWDPGHSGGVESSLPTGRVTF